MENGENGGGARLALRGQDTNGNGNGAGGNRFSVRAGHAPSLGDTPTLSKPPPPHRHGSAVTGGGVSSCASSNAAEELDGSPPPPPLSPHRPCDEAGKTPGSPGPGSQHFYQPPSEPGAKEGEEPQSQHYHQGLRPHDHPHPQHQQHQHPGAAYPETPEAAVYVGAAVTHAEEDGPPTPWRFFNLPRRKEDELRPPPVLPGDRLMRDEAPSSASMDGQPVSATE
jgi:hypothetical protein